MIDKHGFNTLTKEYGDITKIPLELIYDVDNSVLKELSSKDKTRLVENIIDYWQSKGFPYDDYDDAEISREFKLLSGMDSKDIACGKNGKEIGQCLTGLGTVNTFHPHRYEVQCRKFSTPMDNFKDRDRFRKVLVKAINFVGNPMHLNSFKGMLRVFSGTHIASNFRPSAAKFIYMKFCPARGKVLDPSLGYSGRLMGALTSHVSHYEGCDPCKKTFDGGTKFYETIKRLENKGSKLSDFFEEGFKTNLPKVILHNIPFEEYLNAVGDTRDEFFDLTFTSPPYFNVEKYSDEETQSWKKYSTYENWLNSFLLPSIKTCYRVLKPGGYMIYNVAGKKPPIEKDTVRLGDEIFGKSHDTYWLRLSKMFGTKQGGKEENNRRDCKVEPLFIWKK